MNLLINSDARKYTIIRPDPTLQNNLMAFGFEVGPGWVPLVAELMDKIQDLVDDNPKYADLEVVQVKEKYGELRVYTNSDFDEVEELINEYSERLDTVCDRCGEPGKLQSINGWYRVSCDGCK